MNCLGSECVFCLVLYGCNAMLIYPKGSLSSKMYNVRPSVPESVHELQIVVSN